MHFILQETVSLNIMGSYLPLQNKNVLYFYLQMKIWYIERCILATVSYILIGQYYSSDTTFHWRPVNIVLLSSTFWY